MVCLYLCVHCQSGDHKNCKGSNPAQDGAYGGSLCSCGCKGDADWNKKKPFGIQTKAQMERFFKWAKMHPELGLESEDSKKGE